MVAGRSNAPENIPPSTEITVKSTMLMLSNPRRMQKALAANARKIDIIMVRIMAEMMFWFKTGDFFSVPGLRYQYGGLSLIWNLMHRICSLSSRLLQG